MNDPYDAARHLQNLQIVKNYGDVCDGKYLFAWDEGSRKLAFCPLCRKYVLIQISEYHGMTDGCYTDWFPVSGEDEAADLNHLYDGFEIEKEFPTRFLMETNGRFSFRKGE